MKLKGFDDCQNASKNCSEHLSCQLLQEVKLCYQLHIDKNFWKKEK